MPALVIDGLTVAVGASAPNEGVDDVTDYARMFDRSMRVLVRTRKRSWEVVTTHLSDADRTALEAKLNATTLPLTCSGDILGGSVDCIPQRRGVTPVWVNGARRSVVAFTLHEA